MTTVSAAGDTPLVNSLEEVDDSIGEADVADLEREARQGSIEHQCRLAQVLLKRAEVKDDENAAESARQAVHWLIQASRQGSDVATQILAGCLDTQMGVDESNLEDVSWCLQTPQHEKEARLGAKKLFRMLNPTKESEGTMSKEDFLQGLQQLGCNKSEKKMLEKAGKGSEDQSVSEDMFVNKLMKRLHGLSGLGVTNILQQDVEWEAYSNATYVQKVTKYPGKTLSWIADHAIEVTGKQGMTWIRSLVPTNQIYMLMVFFIYSLISVQVVLWFLPIFIFYVSFIAVILFTMQMFYAKRKMRDVKALAEMLKRFNQALDSESAESAYSWNSLTPYIGYFIALLFTIVAFTIADKTWIPCSEIVFVAGFFTVGCFFALSDKYDYLAILSIALDMVSLLPAIMIGFPHIPIVYQLLNLFCGTLFSVELLPEMFLQFGLPSLAYLIVPLLFIRMAMQQSGKGTYRVLVPHLVCFFWWRLAITFFRYSSWFGLIRASLGWVMFIVLLPFLTLLFFLWVGMYLFSVLTVSNIFKVATTLLLLAIPAGFAFWAKRGFKIKGVTLDTGSNKVKVFLAVLFAFSILPMAFIFSPPERDVGGHYVSWEHYRELCSKPQWDKTNMADAMIVCSHLTDTMVEWEGPVKKIVVKKMENQAESFINMLPWAVGNWLRCTYGDEYPNCDQIEDSRMRIVCQMNSLQGRGCHMKDLNRYTFEMWVTMPVDGTTVHDVRVEASYWFRDALVKIQENDVVKFRAALKGELGNVWPVLKLYHIECKTCGEPVEFGTRGISTRFLESYGILIHVKHAFQGLWNFFVAPVIEFVRE